TPGNALVRGLYGASTGTEIPVAATGNHFVQAWSRDAVRSPKRARWLRSASGRSKVLVKDSRFCLSSRVWYGEISKPLETAFGVVAVYVPLASSAASDAALALTPVGLTARGES